MRIPTPSDVLIICVSPVSLAFATLLAKGGLNVLVIDQTESQTFENTETLNLSAYSVEILKQHGFKLDDKTTEDGFTEQSLSLLAHSLCCVIWRTKFLDATGKEVRLLESEVVQLHHTDFIFKLDDLVIDVTNDEANFRNIFALAWRVIYVKLKKINPFILHSFEKEKDLIATFYLRKNETGFLNKWLTKLNPLKYNTLRLTDSPINLHLSQQRVLEAGQVLPNLPFFDEKLKQSSSLHNWCSYQHFSMIIFGSINPQYLFNIAKWVQLNFNIKAYYIPFSERNQELFKTLEISETEKRTLIIRPDKYICMINDTVETDIIDNYLRNVLMMIPDGE